MEDLIIRPITFPDYHLCIHSFGAILLIGRDLHYGRNSPMSPQTLNQPMLENHNSHTVTQALSSYEPCACFWHQTHRDSYYN